MRKRTNGAAGDRLREAQRGWELGRLRYRGPGRIPTELWLLTAEQGVEPTGRKLRLNSERLDAWQSCAASGDRAPRRQRSEAELPSECSILLYEALQSVGKFAASGRRRKRLSFLLIKFDGFIHDPAEFRENLLLVRAVATPVDQSWCTAHKAMILL